MPGGEDPLRTEGMNQGRLAVFRTEDSVTLSFRDRVYVIARGEPFFNIAQVCLDKGDFIPFFVEMARREGVGPEFRDRLREEITRLEEEQDAGD